MHLSRRSFRRRHPVAAVALLLAVAALGTGVAFAAAGGPDPSFNGGATRLIDFPGSTSDEIDQVALAPDGSIVVAGCGCDGQYAIDLARLAPSGEPVDAFGDHGTLVDSAIAGLNTSPLALAVDGTGDILVGVHARAQSAAVLEHQRWGSGDDSTRGDFTIVRYGADGTQKGVSRIPLDLALEGWARLKAIVPQRDGGLLVAGGTYDFFASPQFVVVRLDADGELDSSFGIGGIDMDATADAYALVGGHQAGAAPGSMVLAGPTFNSDIVLRRYLADGSIDTNYGGRFPSAGQYFFAAGGALAPDGGMYIFSDNRVVHFTDAGTPDAEWGTDGVAASNLDAINAMTVQPDGKPLAVGTDGEGHTVIARLTLAGAPDETFGDGGRIVLPLTDDANVMTPGGVVVQADGKAVVAGTIAKVQTGTNGVRALEPDQRLGWVARLDGDPAPVTTSTQTTTPAPPAAAAKPAPAPVAAAGTLSLPAAKPCVSRRSFSIHLRIPRDAKATSAVVKVDGKQVKVLKGSRLKAPVNLKGLPKGRFTVSITVKLANGKTLKGTRRYRTCTTKKDGTIPVL